MAAANMEKRARFMVQKFKCVLYLYTIGRALARINFHFRAFFFRLLLILAHIIALLQAFLLSRGLSCGISSLVMMTLMATYVHDLEPVLLEIPGTPLAVRWYGLAYLAGFVLGYYVLLYFSKKKLYCVEPDKLPDFVAMYACLVGVVCGGRLGEFFFYWLPENGLSGFLEDPLWVFRVWEGGMASHGGIIGVIFVAWLYARRHAHSFPAVLDGLAIVAPIGLCFGRIANFINGELWGRVCSADNPIAVKFPQEIGLFAYSQMPAAMQERVAELLPARYPSQLFEAVGEGLLIFLVLLVLRLKWRQAPAGVFAGLFGVLYAIARVVCECYKAPDDVVWHGITKGQWLSFGVFAAGAAFLIFAFSHKNTPNLQKN